MSSFDAQSNGQVPASNEPAQVAVAPGPPSEAGEAPQAIAQVKMTTAPSPQPPSQAAGPRPASIASPCRFFMMGTCRNGSECRFSHDPALAAQHSTSAPPAYGYSSSAPSAGGGPAGAQQKPFTIINTPPNHPIYSIDVECVATGVQHNARSIAQVALVDEWARPIFNVLIKQQQPVLSYITPLTGLTKEMIDEHGVPLADALAMLRACLPSSAILVGQNILKDVQWLQLVEGLDFNSLIDISALFRVWNPQRQEYTGFSQDHCAKVWLGVEARASHDAMGDAQISMSLFNAYRHTQWDHRHMLHMQHLALTTPRIPGFSSLNPSVDGCCMGNHKKCTCGAPFL